MTILEPLCYVDTPFKNKVKRIYIPQFKANCRCIHVTRAKCTIECVKLITFMYYLLFHV